MGRRFVLGLLLGLSPTVMAQGTPQRGGTIQLALATTPGSLNPVLPSELASNIINWTLFSPLTLVNPCTNRLEPYLAERWEAAANLTEWTFLFAATPSGTMADPSPQKT